MYPCLCLYLYVYNIWCFVTHMILWHQIERRSVKEGRHMNVYAEVYIFFIIYASILCTRISTLWWLWLLLLLLSCLSSRKTYVYHNENMTKLWCAHNVKCYTVQRINLFVIQAMYYYVFCVLCSSQKMCGRLFTVSGCYGNNVYEYK